MFNLSDVLKGIKDEALGRVVLGSNTKPIDDPIGTSFTIITGTVEEEGETKTDGYLFDIVSPGKFMVYALGDSKDPKKYFMGIAIVDFKTYTNLMEWSLRILNLRKKRRELA